MGQKRIVAPDTPIRSFPTPNLEDLVVVVDVDSRLPGYKPLEYGTLHPDQARFKGAKLVYQEPLDGSDSFVRRIYATDRVDQDAYNYAIKYSGGSHDHPIYIRTYVEPREGYAPLPDGTEDPKLKGAVLVDEEAAPVDGELNSLYMRVTRVYETLPGPVITSFETNEAGQKVTVTTQRKSSSGYTLPQASAVSFPAAQAEDTGVVTEQIRTVPSIFARKQFSAERPDMLPQKFRSAVPDIETSEIVSGTATQPVLLQGDISASETQQTLFIKQISRRSRTAPTYPVTIVETTATRSGQLATVTSTLDDSIQTADTGPLVESSEVTDLGDGRSIKVTTEVDEVFEQPSFTRAKEDLTPQKFRASVSETTEERTVSGAAVMPPTLGPNQFTRTEEQITVDRKRVRTQERNIATTSTLTEQIITPEGQLATRTLTLSDQPQSVTPSATVVDGQIEQLGDGRTVKTEVAVDEVFEQAAFTRSKEDLTPQKFKASVAETSEERTIEGTAAMPGSLGPNEFAKTEQQVTVHKKRIRTQSRNITSTETLSEQIVTPEGQLATRTLTLSDQQQTVTPSATLVEAQVEQLGDGRTVKTEVTVDEVFPAAVYTRSREDLTPPKFRSEISETLVEETVEGQAAMPASLTSDQFSRSEQQVTVDKKRTRTQTRTTATTATLAGQTFTTDLGGGLATVAETYGNDLTLTPGFGTVAAEKEALGNGKFATRHVTLNTPLAVLSGQVYDEELDFVVPFTQQVIPAGQSLGAARTSLDPRDVYHTVSRQLDVNTYRARILEEHYRVGAYVNVELPDRLLGVEAVICRSVSSGSSTATGTSWSIRASGTAAATVDIRFNIKNGYTGPVPATRHVFFLDKNNASFSAIAAKTGGSAFPQLFPEPVTFTTVSGSVTQEITQASSIDIMSASASSGSGTSFGTSLSSSISVIPPTLHSGLNVTVQNLSVGSFAPNTKVISVEGDLAFGTVALNTTVQKTMTIRSTGTQPVSVTGITAPTAYTVSPTGPFTVAAGGSQAVTVSFRPTAAQPYNGNITVASDAVAGSGTRAVTGAGGQATVPPTSGGGGGGSGGGGISSSGALTFTPEYWPKQISATSPASFPAGDYIVSVNTESFRYGLVRVTAVVAHISSAYV